MARQPNREDVKAAQKKLNRTRGRMLGSARFDREKALQGRAHAAASGKGKKLGLKKSATEMMQQQKRKSKLGTNPSRGKQMGGAGKRMTSESMRKARGARSLFGSKQRRLSSRAQALRTAASSTRKAPSLQQRLAQGRKRMQKKGIATTRGRQFGVGRNLRGVSAKGLRKRLSRSKK